MSSVSVSKGKGKRETKCLCRFSVVTAGMKPNSSTLGVGIGCEVRSDLHTKGVLSHLLLLQSLLPLALPA